MLTAVMRHPEAKAIDGAWTCSRSEAARLINTA